MSLTSRLTAIVATIAALLGAAVGPVATAPARVTPVTTNEPSPTSRDLRDRQIVPLVGTGPATEVSSPSTAGPTVWDLLAECESNGDWHIDTGNGYFGGLQFSLRSWRWVGGGGYPHQASKDEQIRRAERLLELQGWVAWPACSRKLGLR